MKTTNMKKEAEEEEEEEEEEEAVEDRAKTATGGWRTKAAGAG